MHFCANESSASGALTGVVIERHLLDSVMPCAVRPQGAPSRTPRPGRSFEAAVLFFQVTLCSPNGQYQAGEGVSAVAGVAQSLGIDQQQVLACFGTAVAAQDSTIIVGGTASATSTATASGSATASAPAALPSTGGASLIALGAGALLVAGGLLARRIVR